jgi:class 3 adenylate cyclase
MPDELDNPSAQFLERKLATILSADVAEFSRLMGEDEEQTLRVFRGHKQVFESLVAMHRGRIFNTAGDAILAEFASAVEAVRCATDIQAALRTRNDQLPPSRQVRFRMGINLGDVMLHGQDLLGDGVNVAARLQTAAQPGGICISGSVHDQISNKLSLSFQSLGEMNFKNIQQPIRTFSIAEAGSRGAAPSPKRRDAGSNSAKWIAAGVLLLVLLAGGGYWAYSVNEQSKRAPAPAIATAVQPDVIPPKEIPPAGEPQAKPEEARGQTTPHADTQRSAGAAPSGAGSGRYDGVYSGQICYGKTPKLEERCYDAAGTIRGNKIASRWTMGHEKKTDLVLAGDVTRSGDVTIEIEELSPADGSRLATIDLVGTLRGGLLNASGSFRRGRPATLNWHKTSGASR